MLPFHTGDRIFCLLCRGNRLLIHSKSIQRYPIYLSLHKILDGTDKNAFKLLRKLDKSTNITLFAFHSISEYPKLG